MFEGGIQVSALAWLLTYGVHSTILLGLAWLACRQGWVRSVRARELLWRATLIGGLVTAGVQFGVGYEPWAGRYVLEPVEAQAAPLTLAELDALALLAQQPGFADAAPRPAEVAAQPERGTVVDWTRWALLGWAACGLLLLTLLLNAMRRLRGHLAGRRALTEGELPRLLAELRSAAGLRRRVRLSVSPRIQAPIAMGTLFPHIVVPPRAVTELGAELQAPMLAHELGHIARFDPLWLDFCRLLETVFFFQPLNRVARRHLAECAEFQCDAWAVERTGDRMSLARCLAEVAGWLVGERRALPACGMAELRSPLAERVTRILHAEPERSPRRMRTVLAGTTLLGLTVVGAPGFAGPAQAPEPKRSALETLPAPAQPELPTDLAAQLIDVLDFLVEELAFVEDELVATRMEADRRDVPENVYLALTELEDRTNRMRAQQTRLRSLLALYRQRASQPALSAAPETTESR